MNISMAFVMIFDLLFICIVDDGKGSLACFSIKLEGVYMSTKQSKRKSKKGATKSYGCSYFRCNLQKGLARKSVWLPRPQNQVRSSSSPCVSPTFGFINDVCVQPGKGYSCVVENSGVPFLPDSPPC